MFEVMTGEQTPEVSEMKSPTEWIEENKDLIQDFLNYSKAKTNAVGLAANQLSKDGDRFMERMFCSRAKGEGDGSWRVFINPRIVEKYGEAQPRDEGCLTWPGKKVLAKRHLRIDVEWWNPDGTQESQELTGWEAQVWQHEQDHLDGVEETIVVANHRTIRSTKIGRNEPCPCGKEVDGKPVKYKKCCGR
ncbi:MAG TPA: peptide deformylase [Patescibacteria group bacterium]|nr:peptide deformylase [Patescibacteria group bacterium]